MVGLERRAMIRQMGVATIAVPAWSMLVSSAFAEEDLYVPSRYENFKRGTIAQGARIDGIPGSEHQIRLFSMAGMVVATDPQHATVDIINASGGEPDKPAPDSGEVIRLPQIQSENGRGALTGLKPGDKLTTVYSVQTAFKVVIIR